MERGGTIALIESLLNPACCRERGGKHVLAVGKEDRVLYESFYSVALAWFAVIE
jgi:hypothetical protein